MAMRIKFRSFFITRFLHALISLSVSLTGIALAAQDEKSPQEIIKGEWLISATG